MFSEKLDRNAMDFKYNEEELQITFEKDTVEEAHIATSEDTPLINISVTPKLSDLGDFIDKEYYKYVTWRGKKFPSNDTSSASEFITVYGTFNNIKLVLVVINHL